MTEYITEKIENLFESVCLNHVIEQLIKSEYDVEYYKIKPGDELKYKDEIRYKKQRIIEKEKLGYGKIEFDETKYIQDQKYRKFRNIIQQILYEFADFFKFVGNRFIESIITNNQYIQLIIKHVLLNKLPYKKKSDEVIELIKKSYLYNEYKKKIDELIKKEKRINKTLIQHQKNVLIDLIRYPTDESRYYVKIFDDLYDYYKDTIANKRKPRIEIDDRLKNFAIEDIENERPKMNIDEFIDKTYIWWEGSKRRNEELYKIYSDEYDRLNPNNIISTSFNEESFFNKGIGYKSQNKIKHLLKNENIKNYHKSPEKNYFPLKQNQKSFSLHTIAPKDSYLIDLMFENKIICYLVCININTRKLWVELTNMTEEDIENEENKNEIKDEQRLKKIQQKTTSAYINALKKIMKKTSIKYLKGDGEPAFKSKNAENLYKTKGINKNNENKFIEVNRQITKYPEFMKDLNMVKSIKSEPTHSTLGIIDRVIRTIRDIAYNLGFGIITPKRMEYIVDLYNNAPHDTLTKYAGQPVSPNDVDNDEKLERFIVRRIQQENFNIISQYGFDIEPGEEVIVYNERNQMAKRRNEIEPEIMKVKERKGALYVLNDGREISRTKIHPKNKPYKYYEFF